MKNLKFVVTVIYFCLSFAFVHAKEINVGDKITLKIDKNISKDSLLKSFEKYEVEELKENKNDYLLSFRIYETGTHKIVVGGLTLNVEVKSLLSEEDKEIYLEFSGENSEEKLSFGELQAPYPIELLYFIPLIPLLALMYWYYKNKKNKKEELSPIDEFNNSILKLSDEEYYFQLSYSLRKYLDSSLSTKFLSGVYQEQNNLIDEDLEKLLSTLDQQKFNPLSTLSSEREKFKNEAIKIVGKIEEKRWNLNMEQEKGESGGN